MWVFLFLLLQEEPIPTLIERLGSDSVEEREEATCRLRSRVDEAQEELETAAGHPDPEVAQRALEILRTPSPHRLDVDGEMAHLYQHALASLEPGQADRCAALCDAMLSVDDRFAPALGLKKWLEEGFRLTPPAADWSSLRIPPRRTWEALRRRIRETALAGIDRPADGSRCPVAVRCRLEALRIHLEFEQATLEDVLNLLRDLTGLNLILDAQAVSISDMDRRITFRSHHQSVGESLRQILRESGEEYVITEEGVVLVRPAQSSREAGRPDSALRDPGGP